MDSGPSAHGPLPKAGLGLGLGLCELRISVVTPQVAVSIFLLTKSRKSSSSMAAKLIDHALSLKITPQTYSSQSWAMSSRVPDPIVLSRSLRGRPNASLPVQLLILNSLRCLVRRLANTSLRSSLATVIARRKHWRQSLHTCA